MRIHSNRSWVPRFLFFIYQNNIKPSYLKLNISLLRFSKLKKKIINWKIMKNHDMEINYDRNQLIIILIACMELILFWVKIVFLDGNRHFNLVLNLNWSHLIPYWAIIHFLDFKIRSTRPRNIQIHLDSTYQAYQHKPSHKLRPN